MWQQLAQVDEKPTDSHVSKGLMWVKKIYFTKALSK
jgi:hypothetical protein